MSTQCVGPCTKNEALDLPNNTPAPHVPSGSGMTVEQLQALLATGTPFQMGGSLELTGENPGDSAMSARTHWSNFLFLFPTSKKPSFSEDNSEIYVGEMGRGVSNDYTYIRAVPGPGADPIGTPVPNLNTEIRFYDNGTVSLGILSDGSPDLQISPTGDVIRNGVTVNLFDLQTRLEALEAAQPAGE